MFLKVFNDITKFFSQRAEICSSIIPTVKVISDLGDKALSSESFDGLKEMILACNQAGNHRFQKYVKDKDLMAATFLDPRYKEKYFEPTSFCNEILDELKSLFKNELTTLGLWVEEGDTVLQPDVPSTSSSNDFSFDFSSVLESFQGSSVDQPGRQQSSLVLDDEIQKYMSLINIDRTSCPISW